MAMNIECLKDKLQPAYDGARFDKSGYCLNHPMVRLCKPASSSQSLLSPDDEQVQRNGKYIIIRKICYRCGEHSLRNERKLDI